MADQTSAEMTMSRADLAAYLREVADELGGDGEANVPVGNKTVTLEPSAEIECNVDVEERSPMIGSDKKTITIEMAWAHQG